MRTEVAWAIEHTKSNYLAARYHRLARRLGKSNAVVAVAHSNLTITYYILRDESTYRDLGAGYFDDLDKERLQRHHVRRLEQLGYIVALSTRAVP